MKFTKKTPECIKRPLNINLLEGKDLYDAILDDLMTATTPAQVKLLLSRYKKVIKGNIDPEILKAQLLAETDLEIFPEDITSLDIERLLFPPKEDRLAYFRGRQTRNRGLSDLEPYE